MIRKSVTITKEDDDKLIAIARESDDTVSRVFRRLINNEYDRLKSKGEVPWES